MRSLFTPAINQPLNTLIDSATITISGIGTGVSLTLVSGVGTSVYKNGANVTSTTISNGDLIRMRVRSSTEYATPTFGVIKIGNEETIFAVSSITDPTPISTASMDGILPIDLVTNADGSEYIPSNVNNAISIYDSGVLTKTVPLVAPTANTIKTTDAVVIANYHSGQIFWLNSTFDVIAAVTPEGIAGSKPYGIAVSTTSATDDSTLTWVTLSASNKVVVYDKNLSIVATYATGTRPLGICSSADRRHIYVANYGSNSVTHFTSTNDVWSAVTVNVGSKPFEIVVDANNAAWITHVGVDQVTQITSANAVNVFALAVQGLRGIVLDGDGLIWVAASKSNSIVRLNLSGAVTLTVPTSAYPYALALAAGGSIDVSCFVQSKVQSYSVAGVLVRSFDTAKYPYGLSTYGTSSVVANLYSNTPDYTSLKDQLATAFSIADPLRVAKNSVITSSTFTVSGLGTGISVAAGVSGDLYLSKIVKNGIAVGPSTTVVNGDTIAIQFTSPNFYDTAIEIPLFVGNVYENFTSKTELEDVTPNELVFTDVVNANIQEVYTSNTVTVSGIGAGTSVPFSADSGTIILNGVEQATLSINIKNGDTIALRVTTSSVEKKSVNVTTLAGKIITRADGSVTTQNKEIWTVTTKQLLSELWIRPEFKNLDEFVPVVPLTYEVNGKYITRISYDNVVASLPISNVEVEHVNGSLLIPSYYDGSVYQYDGSTGFSLIAAEPTSQRPVGIANNRFIAYVGDSNVLVDVQTGARLNLPAVPRKVLYDASTSAIYISLSDGTVAKVVDGAITNTYLLGGSPYALALDSAGGLWVSDIQSDVVKYVVAGVVTKLIPTGRGVWDMAVSSTHLWTANSYDNTVSKIDTLTSAVTTIKVSSVPSQVEIDINGAIWIGHYGAKKVWKLDPMSNAKTYELALQYASPSYMTQFEGNVYVTELKPTLLEDQNKAAILTPLLISFNESIDELVNTRVQSNIVTIANLIRPTSVSIEPNNDYDLYVNGIKIANGASAIIDNGDKVYLDALTSSSYYVERNLPLMDFQSTINYKVRTETYLKPDPVSFADLYDAVLRVNVESNGVVISGMTDGQTTTLSVNRSGWGVSVNGAAFSPTGSVKNGDVVKLVGPVRGPYGSVSSFIMYAGKHQYVVGTFTVHTKVLGGANLFSRNNRYLISTSWDAGTHRNATWVRADSQTVFERSLSSLNRHETDEIKFELKTSGAVSLNYPAEIQFVLKSNAVQNTTDTIPFERLDYGTTPSNEIIEYATGLSMARVELDMPEFIKRIQSVHDIEADELQPIPSVFNGWVSNRHDSEEPVYIMQQSHNQKLSPEPLYETRKVIVAATVEMNYAVREGRDHLTVNMQYARNTIHSVHESGTTFQRNAVRLTKSFTAEFLLRRDRSSFLISPPTEFVSRLRRSLKTMDHHEFDKLPAAYKTVPANEFIAATSFSAMSLTWETPKWEKPALSPFKLVDAMLPQIATQSVVKIAVPSFIRQEMSNILLTRVYARSPYVIHNYTFGETSEIEGAYSTSALAIAAGVAAGYPKAYAVVLGVGRYMWATPIETGNYCGLPIGGGTSPIPEKWYVHGG